MFPRCSFSLRTDISPCMMCYKLLVRSVKIVRRYDKLSGLGQGLIVVSFELGKVIPCFIKFAEFLDNVCDNYVVKKIVIH
jgi:hypothetical protein